MSVGSVIIGVAAGRGDGTAKLGLIRAKSVLDSQSGTIYISLCVELLVLTL
jgi:hypothetical protein